MRTLPKELATHLAGDATTTCHAWRVTRADGVQLGFTDHDEDLTVDGTVCRAASGFSASDNEAASGMAANAGEVQGGFSSDTIAEEDLAVGAFDHARVELFLVNWADPSQLTRLDVREIGEVTRAGEAFTAELRSMAHRLDQPQGRVYGRRCDASLGDSRCRVALAAFQANATVTEQDDRSHLTVTGLGERASGFFDQGSVRFADGSTAMIERHVAEDAGAGRLTLWLPLERDVAESEAVVLTAGCDKSFTTCRARFANGLNFRGFPHMPGSDFSYSYADADGQHDGGVLFP
ncbi:DUF2163 domain-containing protein [Rhizobium sp. FKY42]|uniref:DUF2163 domain-containing protein n=1 Tax=Rhizobium sp. FKY42 TaxID=2562310 RepID=UPI0010BF6BC5|nr:DUF2163 domain-containing protein [Rhizobium sp. FKY42]